MTTLPTTFETDLKNGMMLRAISLRQPWAGLMAIGAKLYRLARVDRDSRRQSNER
jgi:hypothetical protein